MEGKKNPMIYPDMLNYSLTGVFQGLLVISWAWE